MWLALVLKTHCGSALLNHCYKVFGENQDKKICNAYCECLSCLLVNFMGDLNLQQINCEKVFFFIAAVSAAVTREERMEDSLARAVLMTVSW